MKIPETQEEKDQIDYEQHLYDTEFSYFLSNFLPRVGIESLELYYILLMEDIFEHNFVDSPTGFQRKFFHTEERKRLLEKHNLKFLSSSERNYYNDKRTGYFAKLESADLIHKKRISREEFYKLKLPKFHGVTANNNTPTSWKKEELIIRLQHFLNNL